ncbi:MAG: formylglycine-generating enzyme family protein, partial [Actinobacteria bacterium]|nr:formylglycine-generating enzyme family protein [Actinomycetota bacterium]
PTGPSNGSNRVLRGGSWDHVSDFCRASYRSVFFAPDARDSRAGFRVVRNP